MSYFRSTIGRVVSCILYLVAGAATGGLMLLFAGLGASKGSGPFILGDISLIGSSLLIVAAVTAAFGFRGTGYIALAGAIAVWVFYVPLMVPSLTRASGAGKASVPIVPVVLAILLFMVSIAYPIASIVGLRREDT